MPSSSNVLDASALDQAKVLRTGEVSSEELVRGYLDRIQERNPAITAFVEVMGRRAVAAARKKDGELRRQRGSELPPFFGVPIGIKDLNLVRGTFTRAGSRAFRYFLSPIDDKTTAQLRRGGFVILGKLATAELGALPVTEPDIHAPTRNPWDLTRTSGGSSGGSGAALAAGLLPIAHGSDGAGSIRIPSSFCNLYGLKPSRGRIVDPMGASSDDALPTCGPLARTVEDAAAMLDVLGGISVRRPGFTPLSDAPFLELSRREPGKLRIRFTTTSPLARATPEIDATVHRVAKLLTDLGHHVEDGPPFDGALHEFLPLWQHLVGTVPVVSRSFLQPVTAWLHAAGKKLDAASVLGQHRALSARISAWFGDVDLWLTPTVPIPPPKIGAWKALAPEAAFSEAAVLGAFTALFNVSGQPAASVPAGISSEGHPIGIQIAGRPNADGLVLAVSRQLEVAMPWTARIPGKETQVR